MSFPISTDPYFYAVTIPAVLLKFLIPCGLTGVLIGALLFKVLDAHTVAGNVMLRAPLQAHQAALIAAQARGQSLNQ